MKETLEVYTASIESCQTMLEEVPQKASKRLDSIESKTSEVADLVRKSFAEIREALDKKETEVLERLSEGGTEEEELRKFISETQELIRELPTALESAKAILSKWDITKLTAATAEKVLSIGKKAESSRKAVEASEELDKTEIEINTGNFKKGVKRSLEAVESVHEISMKRVLCVKQTGLTAEKVLSDLVSLHWDKGNEGNEYVVETKKEGEDEWNKKPAYVGKENSCVVYPLEPETKYEFRVMARRRGLETKWSETMYAETKRRTVVPEVDDLIQRLNYSIAIPETCVRLLGDFDDLLHNGKQ